MIFHRFYQFNFLVAYPTILLVAQSSMVCLVPKSLTMQPKSLTMQYTVFPALFPHDGFYAAVNTQDGHYNMLSTT